MRVGFTGRNAVKMAALTMVAALLFAASAFADPHALSLTATETATATVAPAKSTTKKSSSASATKQTSGSSSSDTPSAISTPVDSKTAAFRAQLAAKQAQLDALNAQLASMDTELEIASQQYDQASDQLQQLNSRVAQAQSDLQKARDAYDLQAQVLGKRATSIYKEGTLGGVEVLLDSKSFPDLIDRIKFLSTVGLSDAASADSLKAQKDQMETQLVDLKNSESQAASLEFQMKARKIEVELRIQERQQTMANTQSDLLGLLYGEASRRQAQESALLQQVLSGANKAGIVVEPGSPVETALAYHGVPYLWGGATPAGFDCSGLVMYVFAQHGVILPHYSGSQFQLGTPVDLSQIQPNDCVFFGNPVHHVGIYCGGGYFIEAPHTGDFVKIAKLSDWNGQIAGVRRYPWVTRVGPPKDAVSSTASALKSVP
jgi:cell wall-associated NlpC family hydrolase